MIRARRSEVSSGSCLCKTGAHEEMPHEPFKRTLFEPAYPSAGKQKGTQVKKDSPPQREKKGPHVQRFQEPKSQGAHENVGDIPSQAQLPHGNQCGDPTGGRPSFPVGRHLQAR